MKKYQIPVAFKNGDLKGCSIEAKVYFINEAIRITGSKVSAARMLNIDRGTLYKYLKQTA